MRDLLLKRNELRTKSKALRTIKFEPHIKESVAERETLIQDKIYKKYQLYNNFIKAKEKAKSEEIKSN